jgi:hypothetical protein
MKICLEKSGSQIYDRIVFCLARAFQELGHECAYTVPGYSGDLVVYVSEINRCDLVVVSHVHGFLSKRVGTLYAYELITTKLFFVHHDAPAYSPSYDIGELVEKLLSFQRVKRAIHFCIEDRDVDDFNRLGINSYPINHISTLIYDSSNINGLKKNCQVAFVGHALPPDCTPMPIHFGDGYEQVYYQSYLNRISDFTYSIKNDFDRSALSGNEQVDDINRIANRMLFIMKTSLYSLLQRGYVLSQLEANNICIYGGDPGAGDGGARLIKNNRGCVKYYPHNYDISAVAAIYASTWININVTSMQFDSAVVNRVLDCISVGGFVLTDNKSTLSRITTVASDVSYSNLDELNAKIQKMIDPVNMDYYNEIKRQFMYDVSVNCSPNVVVRYMLSYL